MRALRDRGSVPSGGKDQHGAGTADASGACRFRRGIGTGRPEVRGGLYHYFRCGPEAAPSAPDWLPPTRRLPSARRRSSIRDASRFGSASSSLNVGIDLKNLAFSLERISRRITLSVSSSQWLSCEAIFSLHYFVRSSEGEPVRYGKVPASAKACGDEGLNRVNIELNLNIHRGIARQGCRCGRFFPPGGVIGGAHRVHRSPTDVRADCHISGQPAMPAHR